MESKKLVYLDGIRGLGCVMVFLTHFVYAFYYGMYQFQVESCHLPGNLDIAIGKTPLNLLYNGNSAVRIFWLLSGYLLCRGFFLNRDKKHLIRSAKKRYLRLMPPILVINVLIYLCMKFGLYYNDVAAILAGSTEWFAGFNQFPASFLGMLKESLFGCYFLGSNDYNGVLWTIQMLFLGSYLDYALAAFVSDKKWRWIWYGILAVLLIRTDFISIFLGYVLCDFMHSKLAIKEKLCKNQALNWILFIVGFYFLSYPSAGFGYEGTIWGILPFVFVNYYHILGAFCCLFAILNLKVIQRFFSGKVFQYFGRISYSLYLVHFLVIATFSAWFLLKTEAVLGYNLSCLLNFILTSFFTIGLSELSVRYIEPLSKKGEHLFGKLFAKK